MNIIFLFISKLYSFLILIWSSLYKFKLLKIYKFSTPIISIGNIEIGGTGKTPTTIFLSQLLSKKNITHIIVSRGYKKNIKGTLIISNYKKLLINDPYACGDEAFLLASKLTKVPIIVSEHKEIAIQLGIKKFNPQIILLDDGFQSKKIHRNLDIVLLNQLTTIEQMHLFPTGKLRAPLHDLNNADLIILSKSNLTQNAQLQSLVQTYNIPYLLSNIESSIYQYNTKLKKLQKIEHQIDDSALAISGIGDRKSFELLAKQYCNDIKKFIHYPDHFNYKTNYSQFIKDIQNYQKLSINTIITTYKDFVKIQSLNNNFNRRLQNNNFKLYIIDIEITINQNINQLNDMINKII